MSARRPMTFGIKNVSFHEVFKQKLQRCCHRSSWACTPFFFKFIYLKRRPAEPQLAFIYSKVNNLYICTTLYLCRDSHFCGPFRGDVGLSSDLSPASFLPSYWYAAHLHFVENWVENPPLRHGFLVHLRMKYTESFSCFWKRINEIRMKVRGVSRLLSQKKRTYIQDMVVYLMLYLHSFINTFIRLFMHSFIRSFIKLR
jgi:hypothetical protein